MKEILRKNNIVKGEALKKSMDLVINEAADAVEKSYGPHGQNTIVDLGDGTSDRITKDGYTILQKILYLEPVENNIMLRLKDIARLVVKKSGDGSTSAILLAKEIWNRMDSIEGFNKLPSRKKINKFKKAINLIQEKLDENRKNIQSVEQLEEIANVALNGDDELSSIIREAYEDVGFEGYLDSQISRTEKSYYTSSEGFEISYGYVDGALITDDDETVQLEDANILVFDKRIVGDEYVQIFQSILRLTGEDKLKNITVIAPGFGKKITKYLQATITHAKRNGVVGKFNFIQVPNSTPEEQKKFYDICAMIDASPIMVSQDETFIEEIDGKEQIVMSDVVDKFGKCGKIKSGEGWTRFIEPSGKDSKDVKLRLDTAKRELENIKKDPEGGQFDEFVAKKRIAMLEGSYATIHIGGSTDIEKFNKQHLVEDALLSCEAATKHGYNQAANLTPLLILSNGVECDDAYVEELLNVIKDSYKKTHLTLYKNKGITDKDELDKIIEYEMSNEKVYDVRDYDSNIICAAHTDKYILEAIYSILSLLLTTNQFILPNTNYSEIYRKEN